MMKRCEEVRTSDSEMRKPVPWEALRFDYLDNLHFDYIHPMVLKGKARSCSYLVISN
jgi:hypothetical protein